jgi:hypothetical protein
MRERIVEFFLIAAAIALGFFVGEVMWLLFTIALRWLVTGSPLIHA